MSEIAFAKESIEQNWSDLNDRLWPLHWEEFAVDKDVIPLSPDRAAYLEKEKAGALHLVTARDKGLLVGYYIAFVHRSLHYQETVTSVSDIFFVHPRYDKFGQRGRIVDRLLDVAEGMLRAMGVVRMYVATKHKHPMDPIMRRRGYEITDIIWRKLLR